MSRTAGGELAMAAAVSAGPAPGVARPRVLIIEDERALTEVLVYNLERDGYEAVVAHADGVPAAGVPAAPAGPGVHTAPAEGRGHRRGHLRAGADHRRARQDAAAQARRRRPDRDGARRRLPLPREGLTPRRQSPKRQRG